MFQYLKEKLFRHETSSSNTKCAKVDEKETESSATSCTAQQSNEVDSGSENADSNVLDILAQNLVHHESEPLPVNHNDNFFQIAENENIVDSNQNDGERNLAEMPEEIRNNPAFVKYWNNRYKLFSKYDEGIQLRGECWYTITPEEIAADIARRCSKYDVILDAFCGAGGNAIQYALHCKKVITTDTDPEKLEMAKHNAQIYGVADKIEFILGDFFQVAPSLTADVVFLSPPWGGPSYLNYEEYQLSQVMEQYGGEHVFNVSKQISDRIVYFLPRNINIQQVKSLDPHNDVKIEETYLNDALFAITAYFGDLAKDCSVESTN